MRLRQFLNDLEEIGPKIIATLEATKNDAQDFRAEVAPHKADQLRALASEEGAQKFIIILPVQKEDDVFNLKDTGSIVTQIRFRLFKALLPK